MRFGADTSAIGAINRPLLACCNYNTILFVLFMITAIRVFYSSEDTSCWRIMITIYRKSCPGKFWLVVGILLVLPLVACGPVLVSQQGSQGQAATPPAKTSGGGPT